jgi:hypothetical protein
MYTEKLLFGTRGENRIKSGSSGGGCEQDSHISTEAIVVVVVVVVVVTFPSRSLSTKKILREKHTKLLTT